MVTKKWIKPVEASQSYGNSAKYWRELAIKEKITSSKTTGQYLLEIASIEAFLRGEPQVSREAKQPGVSDDQKELDSIDTKLELEARRAGFMTGAAFTEAIKELKAGQEGLISRIDEYQPQFDEVDRLAEVRREVDVLVAKNQAEARENKSEQANIKRVKDKLQKQYEEFIKEREAVAQQSTNNDKLVNAILCIQNLVQTRQASNSSSRRAELEEWIKNWLLRIIRVYGPVYKVKVALYPGDEKRKGYYREMLCRTKDGSDLPEQYALYEGVDNA